MSVTARFKRWLLKMTIRAAVIVVALGGAVYFARPLLPSWAKQPIDGRIRRLTAPFSSHQSRPR